MAQVDGIVSLDGRPLASGKVLFQPAEGRAAVGVIQKDGTFVLGTYGVSDGAQVGEHKVAVVAYEGASTGRPDPTGKVKSLLAMVPTRYLSADTSGLTFEVNPGSNHADVKLTSP